MNLETLIALGFSESTQTSKRPARYRVACRSCDALVINVTPCHETGCTEAMHECNGCNALIPSRQRYCEDCQ